MPPRPQGVDKVVGMTLHPAHERGRDGVTAMCHHRDPQRAAQALMLLTRARAVLHGRLAPSLDDVAAMAAPVLRHRMALSFAARARGETVDAVIGRLMDDRIGTRRAA